MTRVQQKNPFTSRPGVKKLYGIIEKRDETIAELKKLNSKLKDSLKDLRWRHKYVCRVSHERVLKAKETEKKMYAARLSKLRARYHAKAIAHAKRRLLTERRKHNQTIGRTITRLRSKSSRYMDAVYAFVPLMAYIRMHRMKPQNFQILVITCALGTVKVGTFLKFGFESIIVPRQRLRELVESGHIEKFNGGYFVTYTASMKGRRMFLGFKEYYNKTIEGLTKDEGWQKGQSRWSA